ncbi:MAG TPA: glycosyltransferase [Syntrophobacteraceae bacterium]|nr:glycosyltransferase [Syntrophobacteraceae bacterium]
MTPPPKTILFCSSFGTLRWGGQKSLYHLVTRLDRGKYTPLVLLPTDEDFATALRGKGVTVVIHNFHALKWRNLPVNFSSFQYLLKLIDTYLIALIHTDGPRNTFYAGLAAMMKHRPLVWHIRSSEKDRYDALLVPLCKKIILVADAVRHRFRRFGKQGRKFVTIHNGVDLDDFDQASALSIRSEYHLDEHTLLIGSFARIEPMKGQRLLIEACEKLRNYFPFKLLLYGEIYDSAYHRTCLETIEKLALQEQVIFTGHQQDIAAVMKAMDLVVLNSAFGEAFSRSIIEAMAAGKPVIATDVGGAREAIDDGVSGFVVPPGNTSILSEKIRMLAADVRLREKFGIAGRERVRAFFTIETNVRKTERVYEELLGNTES